MRSAPAAGLVSTIKTSSPRHRSHRGERRFKRLKRSLPTAAQHIECQLGLGGFRVQPWLVTLTYRDDADYDPRQVSQTLNTYEKWAARRGERIAAIWVMELTKRGRPHYHLVLWLRRGLTPPKADKQGWWRHGMTRTERARNATGYLVKYASKGGSDSSAIPRGARLFGIRGLRGVLLRAYRVQMQPFWLRAELIARGNPNGWCRRRPGGWWADADTGELYQSPWIMVDRAKDWSWVDFELRVLSPAPSAGTAGGEGGRGPGG